MNFVDDIDFVFASCRSNNCFLTELTDIINASIRSGVNFDDIKVIIFYLILETIDSVGENPSNRSFAGPTWANEKVGMSNFPLL